MNKKMEEVFYDKELSDTVRDVVMNSPCNFDTAVWFLNASKNHQRDADLIKRLLFAGIKETQVMIFIRAINL